MVSHQGTPTAPVRWSLATHPWGVQDEPSGVVPRGAWRAGASLKQSRGHPGRPTTAGVWEVGPYDVGVVWRTVVGEGRQARVQASRGASAGPTRACRRRETASARASLRLSPAPEA